MSEITKVEDYEKEFSETYDFCEERGLDKRLILTANITGFYKQIRREQKKQFIELINDFSSSEHNDNEVEKNISRGVGLLKNYLLREIEKL